MPFFSSSSLCVPRSFMPVSSITIISSAFLMVVRRWATMSVVLPFDSSLRAFCICISVAHPVMGQALKLLVVLAEGYSLNKRQIALALKDRLETYKVPQLYEQVDAIQRTYNGKINRKYYKK